ncbi:hypothetical protein CGT93_18520 [Vibrio metoecus]|uniref:hypothetical protein n=1 Tax=Vibrio metoecus TaxID=1481663 RepID=UPI000BA8F68E|nr:hypothetical protein [Vibrio metoecus]PAR52095.1 hypothetical protein CGT93_18520 [Vibrio metoecus]
MNYIKTQLSRLKAAVGTSSFWFVLLIIMPVSMLGIWWPVFFEWDSYPSYFMPASWFTFGLGSLAVLSFEKMFSPERSDTYKGANAIVIVLLSMIGCLCYGKALLCELNNKELSVVWSSNDGAFSLNVLGLAIVLNILVWVGHIISKIEYDKDMPSNALGDSYDA